MDLNKEIKLSELFKRGEKKPKAEKSTADEAAREPKEKGSSFLKKEVSFGRRGKSAEPKAPKEPKARKEPKQPKPPRQPRASRRGPKTAQPVPAVPVMRAFNLLPKEDPRQAAGRRPSTAQLVLAVVGLVAIAALASIFLVVNARVADKQKEYDRLREQLAAQNVPVEEPTNDEGDAALVQERQQRTSALASALGARIAWDRLLREFSLIVPEDVWLTTMTARGAGAVDPNAAAGQQPAGSTGATTFEIKGYTREQDGVARLLARMTVLPELSSVRLVSSAQVTVGDDQVVEFSIAATVKTGGGPAGA